MAGPLVVAPERQSWRLRLAWAVGVCLLLAVPATAVAETAAPSLSLAGEAALNATADDPAFASPSYDDGAWPRVQVPASLRQVGAPARADVAWYRIHFRLPPGWTVAHPAIRFGLVTRADITYLNGVRIGGEGTVGRLGTNWHNLAPNLPRLYPFDPALLSPDGDNVLAVKVARIPYIDEGGLLEAPVALVDYGAALPGYLRQLNVFSNFDYFFLGVQSIAMLIVLFAFFVRSRDRATLVFFFIYAAHYLGYLEDTHFLHFAGFNSPWLQFVATLCYDATLPLLIEFIAAVFNQRIGFLGRAVQVVSMIAMIQVPYVDWAPFDWWRVTGIVVWHSSMAVGFALFIYWTVKAVVRRQPHGIPLLIGISVMSVCVVTDITMTTYSTEGHFGFLLSDLGTMLFQLSLAVVAGQRVLAMERALDLANQTILTAHEQERSRLARDIHDGIGQWLSLIKLKLNMVKADFEAGRNAPAEHVETLVGDISHAIEDTRRIAHDLSPALLEQHGLVAAMQSHIDGVMRKDGVRVSLDAPAGLQLPPQVRDHIYRIFQEALKNALDHSAGKSISVRLSAPRSQLRLQIEDDGVGLDGGAPELRMNGSPAASLGMRTMAERASLLGGRLSTSSGAGRGTSILVEVPLRQS